MRLELPASASSLGLTVTALVPVPMVDVDAWVRTRLAEGGFVNTRVEVTTTSCGWPAVAAFGEREGRAALRVFFRFLDVGAFVETSVDDLEAAWATLRDVRPDYSGELASVGHLFR